MAKWWHVSWKRVGITLLVILLTPILVANAVLLVQYQLAPWRAAREFMATNPGIDRVPVAPPDTSLAVLPGEMVEHFGFSVQLPWKDIYRDRTFEDFASISSNGSGSITIRDPAPIIPQVDEMRALANQVPALRLESLRTRYALTAAAMNAKPEQVKWWRTHGQNAKDLNLLLIKSLAEIECQGSLYAIDYGEMRGFQHGNPSVAPYCVKLDLFDGADRHYEIQIGEYPENGPVVTQAEINAMVASLRPITRP